MRYLRFKSVLILILFSSVLTPPVNAQAVDLAWTFGNVGSSSYRLDGFEPSDSGFGDLGSTDPTLPLTIGLRYQVRVINHQAHPFEVLAKAESATRDVVLLSMRNDAPFESDPDVDWRDDGNGTVEFTLTQALFEAMIEGDHIPGYRCLPHLFADGAGRSDLQAVATHELSDPVRCARWTGFDGFVLQVALQIGGKL